MPLFIPDCARRSFNWRNPPRNRDDEWSTLVHYLHADQIRCPQDCLNYRPKWLARILKPFPTFAHIFGRGVAAPFQWFAKLPWQTQVVIIFLFIIIAARQLLPYIIELLKAYHGQ